MLSDWFSEALSLVGDPLMQPLLRARQAKFKQSGQNGRSVIPTIGLLLPSPHYKRRCYFLDVLLTKTAVIIADKPPIAYA